MDDRRDFLKAAVTGGLSAALSAAMPARMAAQVNARTAADIASLNWVSRKIREDASETLQAFLRRDLSTGSVVLVAFPPGWRTEQLVYYNSDEAVFVLDGDFGIGGHTLITGQYCYLPHRMVRRDIYSRTGTLVLAFFSQISKHYDVDRSRTAESNKGLELVDPWQSSWQPLNLPRGGGFSGVVLAKPVRDAAPRDRLFLVSLAPGFGLAGEQHCNAWQEWFLLSGNLLVGEEICHAGAYHYMPAGSSFGPVYTETGALVLARFSGSARIQTTASELAQQALERYLAGSYYLLRPQKPAR